MIVHKQMYPDYKTSDLSQDKKGRGQSYCFLTLEGKIVMEKKKKMQVESTTLNEVPANERKSWWQVAFIEMGIYICVPCLMLGGMMINGMTLKNAIIAALAGYILAAVIMSFSGMMGADYGRPTAVIAKSSFGGTGCTSVMSCCFFVFVIWVVCCSERCLRQSVFCNDERRSWN